MTHMMRYSLMYQDGLKKYTLVKLWSRTILKKNLIMVYEGVYFFYASFYADWNNTGEYELWLYEL